jgi:cell wall assembly regulator SMI1
MPSVRIFAAWETIETELRNQFPDVLETLAPPARPAEIDQIEQICEVALPEDFRASLLRHNGQSGSNWMRGLVNGADMHNVNGIAKHWQMWQMLAADGNEANPSSDTSEEIATDVIWHPKWIPFALTGANLSYVMDLAPRPKGSLGQVFTHAHGEPGRVLAKSFTEWLEGIASWLVGKNYDRDAVKRFGTPWFLPQSF